MFADYDNEHFETDKDESLVSEKFCDLAEVFCDRGSCMYCPHMEGGVNR